MDPQVSQYIDGDGNLQVGQVNAERDVNFYAENAKATEVNLDGYAAGAYLAPACMP